MAEAHACERKRTGREQRNADARPDRRLRARGVHIRRVEVLRKRADVAIARGRTGACAQRLVLHEHGDALLQPLGVVLIRGERREVLRQLLPVRRQRLTAGGQCARSRVELALPGRDLGRRSVERLLPGDELRLGILQLLLRRRDLRRAVSQLRPPGLIRLHERLNGVPGADQLRLIELLLRRHARPEQRGFGKVAACDRRVILRLPVEIALVGRVHRVVYRLDPGELLLPGGIFLLRRDKLLLSGGVVRLALLELRLPGGILRPGRGELLAAGVILRLPALKLALADAIRHDARGKRELERVIRLLLRAERRRQLAERAGVVA